MPKPRERESKSDYIARAIPIFRQEGYSQEEAVGRAYGYYRSYHHAKKSIWRKKSKT